MKLELDERKQERIIKGVFAGIVITIFFGVGGFIAVWYTIKDQVQVALPVWGGIALAAIAVIKFYFMAPTSAIET